MRQPRVNASASTARLQMPGPDEGRASAGAGRGTTASARSGRLMAGLLRTNDGASAETRRPIRRPILSKTAVISDDLNRMTMRPSDTRYMPIQGS